MTILIIVACIALVSCQNVFYIKPSLSDPCFEGEPCLTLSQFTTRNIYSNVTLNFNPGNHTLSTRLVFRGNEFVRIEKSNHTGKSTILCTYFGRIDFINIIMLAGIYNIEFRSCQLQVYHAHVNIINSIFLFNLYGQLQRAYLGPLEWGYGNAGVIASQRSNISLLGSSFERNRAELGAAIFAVDSAIEVRNGSFKNNQALCAARSICLGGVLYAYNSAITIQFSRFLNNSVSHTDDISGV